VSVTTAPAGPEQPEQPEQPEEHVEEQVAVRATKRERLLAAGAEA